MTVDHQIQNNARISRDSPYTRLGSCYQSDRGVYFYIFEVKDDNNDITNTAMLTVDFQMQGHASRSVVRDLPYLMLDSCYQRDFGVFFHMFEVKDHNNDITNTAIITVDLQIKGHALFCVTFHISGWVRAIREISVFIPTYLRFRNTLDIIITAILPVEFEFKGTCFYALLSISQAGFVLSERSRCLCLFPHT